jgi:hypothetical protein
MSLTDYFGVMWNFLGTFLHLFVLNCSTNGTQSISLYRLFTHSFSSENDLTTDVKDGRAT